MGITLFKSYSLLIATILLYQRQLYLHPRHDMSACLHILSNIHNTQHVSTYDQIYTIQSMSPYMIKYTHNTHIINNNTPARNIYTILTIVQLHCHIEQCRFRIRTWTISGVVQHILVLRAPSVYSHIVTASMESVMINRRRVGVVHEHISSHCLRQLIPLYGYYHANRRSRAYVKLLILGFRRVLVTSSSG